MTSVVVDTSAMVAILQGEPTADWLVGELQRATERAIAAPNAVELGVVLEARVPSAVGIAQRALRDAQVHIEAFDEDLSERAVEAWRRFGKGRHRAGLNFGDCCTYALAERIGAPILCTGDDFGMTDLAVRKPPLP